MIKVQPLEIWQEYQKIAEYLTNNNVYETVKINENFYDGKQWEGLNAKNMPTPVFNILQRNGKFMVASIGSNDIAITMIPYSNTVDDIERMEPISKEIENIIEQARIKEASKIVIRNAFVDGAGYMLQSFNPDYETYQDAKGRIENQIIDNTNMYFGNPYSNDIQGQPYIIIALRQYIGQVKKEAKELGVSKDDIDNIMPDNEGTQVNDDSTNLCTVLLKFYKKKKKIKNVKVETDLEGNEIEIVEEKEIETVWFTKCTQKVCLIKPVDLEYRRYPISCFGWDLKKNSYLYNSPMTAVIPNQIFINKCFAIAQMYGLQSAFPKIVFDSAKLEVQDFLDNQTFVGPSMDMWGQVLNFVKVPDFSNNIIELCLQTIQQTKECMGITDAALGQVRPDNTSAIIALQEASSVPLEIQKQNFFVFWEDTVRNLIDIATATYGVRQVLTEDNQVATVNFGGLKDLNFNLTVEIGNGAQFSEVAQINTLDKLVQAGYITPDAYMEAIPSKYIPQKARLIKSYQEMLAQQMPMQPRGSTPADEVVPL